MSALSGRQPADAAEQRHGAPTRPECHHEQVQLPLRLLHDWTALGGDKPTLGRGAAGGPSTTYNCSPYDTSRQGGGQIRVGTKLAYVNYSAHTDFPIDAVKATAQQLLAQAAAVAIECPGPPPTPTPPPAATPLPPPEAEDFPRTYSGIVTFVDTAIRYSLGEPREVTCEDTVEVTATLQADGLLGLSFSRTLLAIGNETDPAGGIRPRCIAQDFAGEVYYGRHDGEVVTLTPKRIPLDLTVSADAIRSRGSEGTTGTSWTITWRIKAFVLTRQGPTGGAAAGAISDKPDRPDDTGGPAEEANGATAGTKDGEAGDAKDDAGGDAATEVSTVEGEAEGGGAPVAGEADDILAAVLPPEAVAAINELLTGEASPEPPTPEAVSAAVVAGLIPIALLAAANALISGAGAAAGAAAESVTALEGVPGGQRAPADEAPPGEAEAPPETPPPLLDPDGKPLIAWQPDAYGPGDDGIEGGPGQVWLDGNWVDPDQARGRVQEILDGEQAAAALRAAQKTNFEADTRMIMDDWLTDRTTANQAEVAALQAAATARENAWTTLENVSSIAQRHNLTTIMEAADQRAFNDDGTINVGYVDELRDILRGQLGMEKAIPDEEGHWLVEGAQDAFNDIRHSTVVRIGAGVLSGGTSEVVFQSQAAWEAMERSFNAAAGRAEELGLTNRWNMADALRAGGGQFVRENLPVNTIETLLDPKAGATDTALSVAMDLFAAMGVRDTMRNVGGSLNQMRAGVSLRDAASFRAGALPGSGAPDDIHKWPPGGAGRRAADDPRHQGPPRGLPDRSRRVRHTPGQRAPRPDGGRPLRHRLTARPGRQLPDHPPPSRRRPTQAGVDQGQDPQPDRRQSTWGRRPGTWGAPPTSSPSPST